MSSDPVVVIGAGLAGLSAACHLAGSGHDVVVLEAGDQLGGRAGVIERGGYRFDAGPVVLTMPEIIERTFNAAGVEMASLLTLRPLDPMYRACFADGSEIRLRHGREAMAEEIRSVSGARDAQQFGRFCDWLEHLYHLEMPNFIDRNFDSRLDLVRSARPALGLVRAGAFRRLAGVVADYFDDERLQRMFSFQALYAGLAPHQALALFAIITYMDTVRGVFLPDGGMHALPDALGRAAQKAGADLRPSIPVQRILLDRGNDGPVRGVRLRDGTVLAASAVVCTVDLPHAYRTMLPGLAPPSVARRGTYAPSALVWHAGVAGAMPERVEHHNIHFGAAWHDAFSALTVEGRRMPDPSVLVTVPTSSTPELAPPDRHVLYALEPVPNLASTIDWDVERLPARDRLVAHLRASGYPLDIDDEVLVDPSDWQALGMEHGSPFGLAHTFFQSGPFRPPNREPRAPGLFFAGAGTVPGIGIPMVLLSGGLAAQRVDRFLRT